MWHKAKMQDQEKIMKYLLLEPIANLFMISDIERFGFESRVQDVWFEEIIEELTAVLLRYHDNLICYSRKMETDYAYVKDIILNYKISVISGKASVVEQIKFLYHMPECVFKMPFLKRRNAHEIIELDKRITKATEEDTLAIAKRYADFPEFEHLYSKDVYERQKQISTRIESGEGIHVFIKEKGEIIAHGNTTAENTVAGMIGGIFVDPAYRNKGLGTQILRYLSEYLESTNRQPCLFYGNPELKHFFIDQGYEPIEEWGVLRRTHE
ncbi:MAG: GNAT family N-acetyltransferase [Clostridia bacterium]|nr:GNAT family N-acetyltransferase [Clostridia bacterium]